MNTSPPKKPEPRSTGDAPGNWLGGMLLMTAGGLVALLCGSCTLIVGGAAVWSTFNSSALAHPTIAASSASTGIVVALIFGGLPTAGGVALFLFGLRIYRGDRRK